MKHQDLSELPSVYVAVDPGICGFSCTVIAKRLEGRIVSVEISGSECKNIQKLSGLFDEMSLQDLFSPVSRNPAYVLAGQAGCHPSCLVPVAILKAAEVAMDMALPKGAEIRFQI
ncbi:DUF6951 family protein [Thermodesulfobacteriota bacterium]